jgi:hypothetical protein
VHPILLVLFAACIALPVWAAGRPTPAGPPCEPGQLYRGEALLLAEAPQPGGAPGRLHWLEPEALPAGVDLQWIAVLEWGGAHGLSLGGPAGRPLWLHAGRLQATLPPAAVRLDRAGFWVAGEAREGLQVELEGVCPPAAQGYQGSARAPRPTPWRALGPSQAHPPARDPAPRPPRGQAHQRPGRRQRAALDGAWRPRWRGGRGLRVLQPAPDQVDPACPLFGTCGGCQLQEMPLGRQRQEKGDLLHRLVGLTEGDGVLRHPVRGAAGAYHYRNKIELSWGNTRFIPESQLEAFRASGESTRRAGSVASCPCPPAPWAHPP